MDWPIKQKKNIFKEKLNSIHQDVLNLIEEPNVLHLRYYI